jgi:nitrate reductase gamma subunit
MRKRPCITILFFSFYSCLILTPLFLLAHAVLWYDSWQIEWWSLPDTVADPMTIIVIVSGLFLYIRRIIAPEIRALTSLSDVFLLLIVLLPFVTGYLAYHQWFAYKSILIIHILSGEILIVAIPFTRLSHMLFFFLTRAYTGSEFGNVRNIRDW